MEPNPPTLRPADEADVLIDLLYKELGTGGYAPRGPPFVDGREAIVEMRDAGFQRWQEVEWAGFHIPFLLEQKLAEKGIDSIHSVITKKKHLFVGQYVWEVRFHADGDKVILGDIASYQEIVRRGEGLGILVVHAVASPDVDRLFLAWHEEEKGKLSDYTIEREREGRPIRPRKVNYYIRKVVALYLPPEAFAEGLRDGWLTEFQKGMRNQGGEDRKPKYRLNLYKIPETYLTTVRNFNEEPEEFAEDYPAFVD